VYWGSLSEVRRPGCEIYI